MRTKEKHRFSKVIAVICVLTLCVTMLTPATYGAAANVNKIVIELQDGIEYYDWDTNSMVDAMDFADDDSGYYDATKYQYKVGDNSIEVLPPTGGSFEKTVVFYVQAENKPDVTVTSGAAKMVANVPTNGLWKVQVSLAKATGDVTFSVAKPVQQYSVTFTSRSGCFIETESKSYDENSDVPFSVKLYEPDKTTLSVRVNGVELKSDSHDGETYYYTIKNLSRTTTVEAIANDKTFSIAPPTGTGFVYAANGSETVTYGGSFSFYVTPEAGRDEPKVFVKDTDDANSNLTQLTSMSNNLYVCSNITANKTIVVTAGDEKSYNVLFEQGTGYEINAQDTKVNHGGNVTFKVTPNAGYKISRVTANNTLISPEADGSYKLSNVTADTIVSVAVQREQYKITYEYDKSSEAYSVVEGKTPAEYGDSYTFYVAAKDGYGSPTVKVNGNPVTSIDGRQYVINIEGETTISVVAGTKNQQTVTFNTGAGYTFTDTKGQKLDVLPLSVEYGKSVQFKIALDEAYTASNVVVTVNGVNLNSDENDIYTISDITENKVVSVSGVQKNTYTVTLQQGTGYVLSTTESTRVTAEDTFTFSLNINPGYTGTPVVMAGNVTVPLDTDGYYRFPVKGNTTVTVSGVNPDTYTIKTNVSHATVDAVSGDIHYNGSYQFTVKADPYYQVDQVAINGVLATAVNGVYTINNIVDNNNTITVVTSPIELTVHYVDEKYNTTVSDRVYTIETTDRTLAMLTAPDGGIYQFTGWKDGSEAVESISDKMLDKGEITLTAEWKLNTESIRNSIKLDTTGSWTEKDDHFVLTFNTVISLVDELSEEYKANVQLTGYGTLYSGQSFGQLTQDDINAILGRNQTVNPDALIREQVRNGVYNYFSNINLATSDLNDDDTFKLILNAKKKADRYGLGWIELTVGNEKIIVYYEEAHLTTSN